MRTISQIFGSPLIAIMLTGALCSCGGDNQGQATRPSSPGSETSTPPTTATQQFVDRAKEGTGSIDLVNATDTVIFSGCLRKNKTEDPRTVGAAAFFTNLTQAEYRLVDFAYVMDTSGIRTGESVETDVGFTVLPRSALVALNSGEELLITHRYDTQPNDRGVSSITIPQGGLAIAPNQRLSIGSVSAIFPLDGSGAKVIDDSRLADGSLFQVCYSATLKRSDWVTGGRIVSYRSPYRDRSYVADPARTTAPFTSFRNTSDKPVRVYGIGSFISNLSSTEPSTHSVEVLINNQTVTTIQLPAHVPGQNSGSLPLAHPVDLTIAPGATLTVKGKVTPNRAIVFDFAAFIFADEGLTSIDENLDMLPVDFNADGYTDIVDLDSSGSFWVSLRVGQGLQNTQQEWARAVGKVDRLIALQPSQSGSVTLQATNNAGLCLNMKSVPSMARFILEYCQNAGSPSLESDIWGDFNGDGFSDRLRVDAPAKAYLVALGSATGLGPDSIWAGGYGAVEKMFVSDANGDGASDVLAEWTNASGLQCKIFYGARDRFRVEDCPR